MTSIRVIALTRAADVKVRSTIKAVIDNHHHAEGSYDGLPRRGSQRREITPIGHREQPAEDIAHIREGIFPVALAGDDQRVDDRGTLAAPGCTMTRPFFLPMAR